MVGEELRRGGERKQGSCLLTFRPWRAQPTFPVPRGCNVLNPGHMGLEEALPLVARAHPGPSTTTVMNPHHPNLVATQELLEPSSLCHPPATHDFGIWLFDAGTLCYGDILAMIIRIITSEIVILLHFVHSKQNKC